MFVALSRDVCPSTSISLFRHSEPSFINYSEIGCESEEVSWTRLYEKWKGIESHIWIDG